MGDGGGDGGFWNPNPTDFADEDEDDGFVKPFGRDGVIFLIDAHPSITADEEKFRLCIDCIKTSMMNIIITSPKDLVGIVFYNTKESPLPKDEIDAEIGLAAPKHTAIFVPLKTLTKESIEYMQHFKDSDDFFDFNTRYGYACSSSTFADALWLASRMFMRCGYKLQTLKLFAFTNTEEPNKSGTHDHTKVLRIANDLRENCVHFTVVPMIDTFDDRPFYREFLCTVNDEDQETYQFISPAEQRERLLNRIFQKDYRSSCLRYIRFTLGGDLAISVGLYSFKNGVFSPSPIHMLANTNQVVVGKRTFVQGRYDDNLSETVYDRPVLPGEQKKVQFIGGQQITFTPEEITNMKALVPPGMRLLGFKPLSTLPQRCFIKNTRFLYPKDDTDIKGSVRLFRALWEKCLEKQKFALCVFSQMRKVAPRYVALVPQQVNPDGNDGFRVVLLPMQTDIRSLDIFDREIPSITNEETQAFQKLTKKLKFKYNEKMFENPYLQMFFSTIEALVFDKDAAPFEDSTLPDVEHQDNKIDPIVDQIIQIFGETLSLAATSSKRPAPSGSNNTQSAKIPKISSVSKDDICSAITSGATTKLTVGILKEYLQSEGIQGLSKLKKNELIDKVKQLCDL